ncbi:fatty acid-binding protein FABP-like protein [Leptotrombidium deliense]|uniref:Fatty acid-binding protein FABP-like protein n=1 Tax=Leptotrombidium deliense TaxID=299467 RepID=A0A443SMP4_9ACAR|nr:fatty acid-binding protein FABP-like protein [Leptotrombidium deliense]
MGDQFVGKWKMVHSDGYEEFLRVLGIPWLTRKAAVASPPTLEITKSANSWQIKTESTFKTSVIVFSLGQEFEEERMDGEKIKSTVTLENNVMIQRSKGSVDHTITREVANEVLKIVTIY